MIPLTPVNSQAMLAYGYDPASQTLAIRFGEGKVTHFADVPPEVGAEFEAAESKGRAYHALIRGKFTGVPVLDEATKEPA
jgi:hypothetical protein